MSTEKVTSTTKIFGELAKEFKFSGVGVTRYIEYPTYYLFINHQKSSYGKSFYINIGIYYKELLSAPLSDADIATAYKRNASVWPHVEFRIESCPNINSKLQEEIDLLANENRMEELKELLKKSLSELLEFTQENNGRKKIRLLSEEKKLSAMILKEV